MIDVKAEICAYLEEAGRGGTRELIAHMAVSYTHLTLPTKRIV